MVIRWQRTESEKTVYVVRAYTWTMDRICGPIIYKRGSDTRSNTLVAPHVPLFWLPTRPHRLSLSLTLPLPQLFSSFFHKPLTWIQLWAPLNLDSQQLHSAHNYAQLKPTTQCLQVHWNIILSNYFSLVLNVILFQF